MGNEAKEEIRQELSKPIAYQTKIQKSANRRKSNIVRELQKKPVYYLKADKGNAIVIMDKQHYDNLVMEKLTGGNYLELRNDSLLGSIKRVEKALKECFLLVDNPARLRMPNPSLPRIRSQSSSTAQQPISGLLRNYAQKKIYLSRLAGKQYIHVCNRFLTNFLLVKFLANSRYIYVLFICTIHS